MSDANKVGLSFAEESSQGVPPTPLDMYSVWYTGEGFSPPTDFTDSEAVVSDLMPTSTTPTGISLEGTPAMEYSYAEQFHLFLPAAINAAGNVASWGGGTYEFKHTAAAVTVAVDAGPPIVYTITAAAADALFAKVTTGQTIRLSGFTNEENNGFFTVEAINLTADPHVVTVSGDSAMIAEVGTDVTLEGSMVRNGRDATWTLNNTQRTFCFEQSYPHLSEPIWFLFKGLQISSMELTLAPKSLVTGSFGFTGTNYTYTTAASPANSITESTLYPIMSAADFRTIIHKDGSVHTVTNFGITISDLARAREVVGNIFNDSTGLNTIPPELNVKEYWSLRSSFLSSYDVQTGKTTPRAYKAQFGDTDGRTFIFTFPNVVLTGVAPPPGAKNADLEIEGTGKVYPITDPVSGQKYHVQIERFGPA